LKKRDFDKAITNYQKSLDIREANNLVADVALSNTSLGLVYKELNDINKAIRQCEFIIGSRTKFLEKLAEVYTYGCQKYSEKSWQSVPNGRTRYEAAIFRHIKDYKNGEWINHEDGGCLHVAQIAFNILAVKWFILKEG